MAAPTKSAAKRRIRYLNLSELLLVLLGAVYTVVALRTYNELLAHQPLETSDMTTVISDPEPLKPAASDSVQNSQVPVSVKYFDESETIVLLGLAQFTKEIRKSTWELLKDFSCGYNVSVHIIAQEIDAEHENVAASKGFCSPILVESQDDLLDEDVRNNNRLLRIAKIRDAQRDRVREEFFSKKSPSALENSKVILLDLDLWDVPKVDQILDRLHHMNGMDVVCGAGNWFDAPDKHKRFYYDNFAFVSWPDTFGFAPHQRLLPQNYLGENTAIIPYSLEKARTLTKKLQKPVPTQYSLFQTLQNQAANHPSGLAPTRSCFGGLAIYRANVWLTPQCGYNVFSMLSPPEMSYEIVFDQTGLERNILRYASKSEKLPCEHVVFHDCLHREAFDDSPQPARPHLGIDPNLVTHWKRNKDSPANKKKKRKNKPKKHNKANKTKR